MGRLKTLPSKLKAAPSRVQTITGGSWRGTRTTAAARGYGADWRRLRAAHLLAHPHCVFCLRDYDMAGLSPADVILTCAERGLVEPIGTIGDHIVPHQGNDRLRLDPRNVQTLCKPHHDGEKAQAERAAGYR
ncbi:HNH endonuclease [Burkholderia sp. USMB20]|uniref:HNH endonuclease n=1 Tax=Burkholderia sp. USMB20 TaxID=1571773 RepID=UPI0005CE8CA9|nr:HNH endonuclease [Burkholderia sp. USMB20]TGN96115.1 HNH endonuclease [Burkholderia sp. USMB20]